MFLKVSQKSKVKSQKPKVKWLQLVIYTFAFCLLPFALNAQCAMCRAALESEEGTAQAEGINDGIVYLMVIPYILVAVAGYFIYKLKYGKK